MKADRESKGRLYDNLFNQAFVFKCKLLMVENGHRYLTKVWQKCLKPIKDRYPAADHRRIIPTRPGLIQTWQPLWQAILWPFHKRPCKHALFRHAHTHDALLFYRLQCNDVS